MLQLDEVTSARLDYLSGRELVRTMVRDMFARVVTRNMVGELQDRVAGCPPA